MAPPGDEPPTGAGTRPGTGAAPSGARPGSGSGQPGCGDGWSSGGDWRNRSNWRHAEDGSVPPWMYHHGRFRGGGPAVWHRPRQRGPIRRSRDERLVGGVAGGLARRLGWDPTVVRVIIVMVSLSGFGLCAYVLGWLFIPLDGGGESIMVRSLSDRRGFALALAVVPLYVIALLVASALGATWISSLALPGLVAVAGFILIWRNADPEEQAVLHRAFGSVARFAQGESERPRWRGVVARIALALVLVVAGLSFLHLAGRSTVMRHRTTSFDDLAGLLLIIAAIVTVFGPWWLRVARDLVVERQARARAEERAEMAARLHDSVLQTLALIQRRADKPQQVVQLARAQERELRAWLFDGGRPAAVGDQDVTFAAGVARIQEEVEALHGISVEVVVVGDCELDEGLRAMLGAGREAAVNAAKWSGAPEVSLFGEVEDSTVSLFVRDRGRGFEPETVSNDRKGIAESIRGRMWRSGGEATIRSRPGEGTEVALVMAREAGRRTKSATGA